MTGRAVKWAIIVLRLCCVAVVFWGPWLLALTGAVQAEDIGDLRSEKAQIEARARALRNKKKEKLHKVYSVNTSIIKNQQKLEGAQRSLQNQKTRLNYTASALQSLSGHMSVTLTQAESLSAEAAQLLRNIYVGGQVSMLEMILSAPDMATFLDRTYYKKKIVERQSSVMANLEEKAIELHLQKRDLIARKSELAESIDNIASYKDEISNRIKVDRTLKERYQNDLSFYEQAERELVNESQRIRNQIVALTRQSRSTRVASSTGMFAWPLSGQLMSRFGYRYHPIHRRRAMHTGIDISAAYGAPIRAADGGNVIFAGWRSGYGKAIIIDHGQRGGVNLVTLYGHLSSIRVGNGTAVSKGQVIGYEGSTGYSTGPHLHFEIRENGNPVNPLKYL